MGLFTKKNKQTDREGPLVATFPLVYGLPLPEGTNVTCYWYKDKAVFEASGASFNLEISKITDITFKSDVEIQKQYVSSTGGAIAGGAMFGPLGAMIGGRVKEKKSKTINIYWIFTYTSENELKYIALDLTNGSLKDRKVFGMITEEFKKMKSSQPQSFDL